VFVKLGVDAALIDGCLVPGDVEVVDGAITQVARPAAGTGLLAAPGFVDLQVNGFAGVDLLAADADGVRTASRALLATGVTAWQPTLITADPADTIRAAQAVEEARDRASSLATDGARLLDVHLEGPFLAEARLGTHPAAHRAEPDLALLDRLLAAAPVGYVTLAPERPGALALVDHLLARGIVVAAGHSDATAAEAHLGFDAGVGTVTHLFNAMRRFSPRDPGLPGAAIARPDVIVQCIVDGWHLAPDTVRIVWAATAGRFALVTDAVAAAGVGDGTCQLGEVTVTVADGAVRRRDGTLAGSVLTMPEAVRGLVALDVPLADAVLAATAVPARVLGRDDLGVLTVGGPADTIVLDAAGHLERVLSGGRTAEVSA
jgi:N-acetylglucosamine-6-phosphate deacetylase